MNALHSMFRALSIPFIIGLVLAQGCKKSVPSEVDVAKAWKTYAAQFIERAPAAMKRVSDEPNRPETRGITEEYRIDHSSQDLQRSQSIQYPYTGIVRIAANNAYLARGEIQKVDYFEDTIELGYDGGNWTPLKASRHHTKQIKNDKFVDVDKTDDLMTSSFVRYAMGK